VLAEGSSETDFVLRHYLLLRRWDIGCSRLARKDLDELNDEILE
jgi:hypothetical protein